MAESGFVIEAYAEDRRTRSLQFSVFRTFVSALRNRVGSAPDSVIQLFSLCIGVCLWQLFGSTLHVAWFPPISAVVARIASLWRTNQLQGPLLLSIENLAIGYLISVVLGVGIGVAMARYRLVNYALGFYVDALLSAPSIMLAPVLFAFLGLSKAVVISVIVLYASVFIVVNTRTAVVGADRTLSDMSASFGATRIQVMRVVLRSAAPLIMVGLRLGMGRAVKGMINGQLFLTVFGLAALDERFAGSFDATGMLAIALVVVAFAIILSSTLDVVNKRVNAWMY